MINHEDVPTIISQQVIIRFAHYAIDNGVGDYELSYKRQMPKVVSDALLSHLKLVTGRDHGHSSAYSYLEDIWRYIKYDADYWLKHYTEGASIEVGDAVHNYSIEYIIDNTSILIKVAKREQPDSKVNIIRCKDGEIIN